MPTRLRVLVADDNVDLAEMLQWMLEHDGHEVQLAADGPSALKLAEQLRPDVVFLDIGLPGLDGCEVARQIRAAPWGSELGLVAHTAYSPDQLPFETRGSEFDAYVPKGSATEVLLRVLRECATKRSRGD